MWLCSAQLVQSIYSSTYVFTWSRFWSQYMFEFGCRSYAILVKCQMKIRFCHLNFKRKIVEEEKAKRRTPPKTSIQKERMIFQGVCHLVSLLVQLSILILPGWTKYEMLLNFFQPNNIVLLFRYWYLEWPQFFYCFPKEI